MSDDRRDAGSRPDQHRPDELGRLIQAAVPAHRSGFWQQLNDRLENAGEDGGPNSGGNPGQAHDESPTRKDTMMSLTLPPAPEGTRPPARDELSNLRSARRRWIPPAVAAGIVGIALTASALVGLGGDDAQPAVPTPPAVSPSTPATPRPSGEVPRSPTRTTSAGISPTGEDGSKQGTDGRKVDPYGTAKVSALEQVDPDLALQGFGSGTRLKVKGTPAFAYEWTDVTGEHLVVLSAVRTGSGGATQDSTLYVTAFRHGEPTDKNDESPGWTTVVRQMSEPGSEPCDVGYPDGFFSRATKLTDTDRDGEGELSVGWFYACSGDMAQVGVKIAVLEGADKYILRGSGYRYPFKDARKEYGGDPMVRVPDPARSEWPKGLYDHAVKVWDSVAW